MEAEQQITTILFDVGGTLLHIDYYFLHKELARAGIRVATKDLRRAEYAARREIDRFILGEMGDAEQGTDETRRQPYFSVLLSQIGVEGDAATQVIEHFNAAHAQYNLWRTMMPSTPGVLRALRERGFTLGVISNADGRISTLLKDSGIAHFFEVVIDSHVVGVEKPDPRIFQLALEQIKTPAAQTLFIGDLYSADVVGAERAGLQAILLDVLDGYGELPCKKICHLQELLTLLPHDSELSSLLTLRMGLD